MDAAGAPAGSAAASAPAGMHVEASSGGDGALVTSAPVYNITQPLQSSGERQQSLHLSDSIYTICTLCWSGCCPTYFAR